MLGTTVDVEMYQSYLEDDEILKSFLVTGLPKDLSDDIASLHINKIQGNCRSV